MSGTVLNKTLMTPKTHQWNDVTMINKKRPQCHSLVHV